MVPTLKAIAAMSLNRAIGFQQRLPWHIPEELQWFRSQTLHQTLIMGRNTFLSMGGRLLPHRTTYILTHHPETLPQVPTISSLEDLPPSVPLAWICGGAALYRQFLPQCSELLLSVIQTQVEGDAFFPPFEDQFGLTDILKKTSEFEVQRWRHK